MKSIYKDIEILTVTYKSDHIISSCLKKIDQKYKITVVENSGRKSFKKIIEKRRNTKCILTGSNLGFGRAFNIGAKSIKKKFILHINPDVVISNKMISEIYKVGSKIKDLGILSTTESSNLTKIKKKNKYKLIEVEYVKGFFMFINNQNCKKSNYFDENFFLYLEEYDLCKRLKKYNYKIYKLPNFIVKHLGGKSHSTKNKVEMEKQRNWHYLWSLFYFTRKYNGYPFALVITLRKFLSSFLKLMFFYFINKRKHEIYKHRFLGLLSSYLCQKAHFRV